MNIEKKIENALTHFIDIFNNPKNLENTHLALLALQNNALTTIQLDLIKDLVQASMSLGFIITPSPNLMLDYLDKLQAV